MHRLSIFFLVLLSFKVSGQGFDPGNPEHHCATQEEQKLYNLITDYRLDNKLPAIEFSKSLSYVARIHAMDLAHNRPDFGGCNPHSWSDKGIWKPCCYSKDENRIACMNNKPKELTTYKFKAWEVVYSGGEDANAQDAFDLWKDINLMNDYLLNTGKWTKPWQAIGVGIYGDYACVWFGEGVDASGKVPYCGLHTQETLSSGNANDTFIIQDEIESGNADMSGTYTQAEAVLQSIPETQNEASVTEESTLADPTLGESPANENTIEADTVKVPVKETINDSDTIITDKTTDKPEQGDLDKSVAGNTTTTYETIEITTTANTKNETDRNSDAYFYIIISSTSTLGQADREVKRLIESGYKNAMYLPNSIFYRIAADKFKEQASAYKALQSIKSEFPDAWLLKPKAIQN